MRATPILASFILLAGCLPNQGLGTSSAAQVNIYRMQQICQGMSEEEVFQILRYPVKDEQILLSDGCYDIWFYVTRATALDQSELRSYNMTPLIFKDGVLVGRGYDYYNRLRSKQKEEAKSQPSVSMSSKPKPKDPPPKKPETPEKDESDPDKPYRRDKDDDRMIEQEQEQDFNYW